jgi:hypothetical protein
MVGAGDFPITDGDRAAALIVARLSDAGFTIKQEGEL